MGNARARAQSRTESQAAEFVGTLWAAIRAAGGPRPASGEHAHFPGAYEPGWLAALPLPTAQTRPPSQRVALTRAHDFDRYTDDQALTGSYAARPRTWVYENVHRSDQCAWLGLATRYLGRLTDSELEVICSLYESRPADENLGRHWDLWYGGIVQVEGAKAWDIGRGVMAGSGQVQRVVTVAGDVLLLPEGLPHLVSTPGEPGASRHLAFALCRHDLGFPIEATMLDG
jgi:hypothetical protein